MPTKHRWKELNPQDTGLESGPQPLLTDVAGVGKKKSRLAPDARLRRLPGAISRWRSHRWAAHARAQLGPEPVVVEGVFTHGSQARRPGHGALPPRLPRVPLAV